MSEFYCSTMPGGEKKLNKTRGKKSSSDKVALKVKINKFVPKKTNTVYEKPIKKEIVKKVMAASARKEPEVEKNYEKDSQLAQRKRDELIKQAIIDTVEDVEERNIKLARKVEQQKLVIMWCGVVFFMLLIVVLWIYNAKNIFSPVSDKGKDSVMTDLSKFNQELNLKMDEMKKSLDKVKEYNQTSSATTTATTTMEAANSAQPISDHSTSTTAATTSSQINQKELKELKQKLDELENKMKK